MQCCVRGGAVAVTIVDLDEQRLAIARSLGATHAINARDQTTALEEIAPYGFDAVIDATGVPSVVEGGMSRVKSGGKLLLFGVCPEDAKISIRPFEIYRRDLSVIGTFALRYSFDPALELIQNGVVQVKPLLRPMVSLDEIPAWFEDPARAQDALKIMFRVT
jgi:D-arabinitol dehydrogenase (NADP+)